MCMTWGFGWAGYSFGFAGYMVHRCAVENQWKHGLLCTKYVCSNIKVASSYLRWHEITRPHRKSHHFVIVIRQMILPVRRKDCDITKYTMFFHPKEDHSCCTCHRKKISLNFFFTIRGRSQKHQFHIKRRKNYYLKRTRINSCGPENPANPTDLFKIRNYALSGEILSKIAGWYKTESSIPPCQISCRCDYYFSQTDSCIIVSFNLVWIDIWSNINIDIENCYQMFHLKSTLLATN